MAGLTKLSTDKGAARLLQLEPPLKRLIKGYDSIGLFRRIGHIKSRPKRSGFTSSDSFLLNDM